MLVKLSDTAGITMVGVFVSIKIAGCGRARKATRERKRVLLVQAIVKRS